MSDDLINTYLGQYHLIEIIGHGGMATVYKAYQPALERFVAIKVLPRTRDPEFAARFKREALTIARLQHPNILAVHDHGTQNGLLYLVMQYVEEGATLSDLMGVPMDVSSALRLMGQLLKALEYAHQRQVIHRDIKPSNVLLAGADWPILADFGIAKLMDESQRFTASGMIFGTAAYMAPEQAIGQPVDRRTDLYASGVILYELLTGRVPFDAQTPLAVLHQHVYEPPPPPRQINPALSVELEQALLRALSKNPDAHYQTAAEMAADLNRLARRLDRSGARNQLRDLYQRGMQAFAAEDWEQAIEQFGQLTALDPDYEDAAEMLDSAREARLRAPERGLPSPDKPSPDLLMSVDGQSTAVKTISLQKAYEPGRPSPQDRRSGNRRVQRWVWLTSVGAALVALTIVMWLRSATLADTSAAQPTAAVSSPRLVAQGAAAVSPANATAAGTPTMSSATAPSTPAPIAEPSQGDQPPDQPTATSTPADTPSPTLPPATPTGPPPEAAVGIEQLTLRRSPSERAMKLGAYPQGTALDIIGRDPAGKWLRVKTPDGRTGWMFREYLNITIALEGVPVIIPTPAPPTRPPAPAPTNLPAPVEPTAPPAPAIEPTAAPPAATPEPTSKPRSKPKPRPTEPP